jgi:hypothetical protein
MYVYTYIYAHIYIYDLYHRYLAPERYSQVDTTQDLSSPMYCISDVSCLRLSCCTNAFIFCVHYLLMPYWLGLCVLRRTCRQSSLYETLFHCNTLSKHHHHQVAVLAIPY